MQAARYLALGSLLCAGFFGSLVGCEEKKSGLSDKECSDLKSQAFKLINSGKDNGGQGCDPKNKDTDCAETKWPECRHAVNTSNSGLIADLQKKFDDGKCKDTTPACKDSPPVYCKEGLCAMKEPGTKEP